MNSNSQAAATNAPLIRTFRAPDAMTALGAVKAAFGADAVIIETKQVGGGLFGRAQVEVTAAAATHAPAPAAAIAPAPTKLVPPARAAAAHAAIAASTAAPAAYRSVETDIAALRQAMDDVRRTLHETRTRRAMVAGADEADDARELSAAGRKVFRHLLERGLDAPEARAMVDAALAAGAERPSEIFADVARQVSRFLMAAPSPWSPDARRTIALVGPTGAGKTTAIAKIAARALMETRFKVGLITVDTYRVGASDQLARYGKIMGVPTYVARDRAALAAAVEKTRDADLVLIDTAGRSDPESLAAQIQLVKTVPNVQLHLVMSAATGAREMAAVARRHRAFGPERLIFTKLDEAEAPAGALGAAAIIGRPVSCICDGQRVPEDIHPVTNEVLADRFLKLGAANSNAGISKETLRGSGR